MTDQGPDVVPEGRVARSRQAVLEAASALLLSGGLPAVTVDAVVARSGVAKSTIYRHWASRDELLCSTVTSLLPPVPDPPADLGFEDSLRYLMRAHVAQLGSPTACRLLPALIEAKLHDDKVADLEQQMEQARLGLLDSVLQAGIDAGHLPADIDREEAILQLFGPVLMAVLAHPRPLDDAFADRLVELFLASRSAAAGVGR